MAVVTGTFTTATPVGNRESLSDVVNMITPRDTPIYSAIPHPSEDRSLFEWEIDTLAAPGANAQLEGDTFTFATVSPVTRAKEYTQILRKDWSISGSQEASKNAGNAEKRKRVQLKRGIEIKKDVEFSIVSNVASVGGQTRISGGLPSWITTNASRGAGGSNGGYNTGTGLTVAETTGTLRAFTQTLLDAVMQSCYSAGANVKKAYLSPYNKGVFVTFMSNSNVATFRYMAESGENNKIVSNADVYASPWGEIEIMPNRVMAGSAAVARRVFCVDPELLEWAWFRAIHNVPDLAKIADSEQGVILGEGGLKATNEAGCGVVADVFGLTAST
ncbi:MAG: DUF5309 family protein [Aestuariivirga sp.]